MPGPRHVIPTSFAGLREVLWRRLATRKVETLHFIEVGLIWSCEMYEYCGAALQLKKWKLWISARSG